MGPRERVRAELEALREAAGGTSVSALRDGTWLVPVVRDALDPYAAETDRVALAYLHEVDEPGTEGRERIADAAIGWAQRRALLAGGLSAGAYASVVIGALATGGLATAFAIPTAAAAFTVDCWYTARVQLQLAWDLAVLYEHPVDIDDDEQLIALCRLAFGIDADDTVASVLTGVVPEVSRFGTRALTTGSRLAYHAALKTMGQTLVQRGVARFAVPAIGVPMCAAVNHVTTGRTGHAARQLLRGHGRARELATDLSDELSATPALVLALLLWMVGADERARGVEATLLHELSAHGAPDLVAALDEALHRDEEALLDAVAAAPVPLRAELFDAGVRAAALDGVLHSEEDRRLRALADACGVPFDPRRVSAAIVAARGE